MVSVPFRGYVVVIPLAKSLILRERDFVSVPFRGYVVVIWLYVDEQFGTHYMFPSPFGVM